VYRVQLERAAEKDLRRLTAEVHRRVIAAIVALGAEPRPAGCRKLHGGNGEWRVRVGDHRIIYTVADTIRVVGIRRVRHRREIYCD
jgi:mRNA interferase RelE/StbE